MDIDIVRYNSKDEFTDGLLLIDGEFMVHTLEDEFRTKKVYGETRIPAGRYKVELRTEGGFHQKYLSKFGSDFHKGMLHIVGVPGFEYVLIHIGNDDDDSSGCLLVGMGNSADDVGFISGSKQAYMKIYPIIRDAILAKEGVYINFYDNVYEI